MSIPERFRQVYDYAEAHGYAGGFPNFHEADYGQGVVEGTLLNKSAEWRDVRATDLGNPPADDLGARFRATHDYAVGNGFVGGFPNFHQADYGSGLVYGTVLLRSNEAEWRDVKASDIGNPPGGDVGARFRATHDYAVTNGFVGGFPNFHQADYGQGLVYGTLLLKPGATEWRDVFRVIRTMFSWPFSAGYTRQQRLQVLERHAFAYTRIHACGNLNAQERQNLFAAYQKSITHDVTNDPDVNAQATVGGSQIWVNLGVLLPQGPRETAQSLIHEMMHIAGYSQHGTRHDPPSPSGNVTACPVANPQPEGHPDHVDCPYDNGHYYGSPELRAELCIAGIQSDRLCVVEGGEKDGRGGRCLVKRVL